MAESEPEEIDSTSVPVARLEIRVESFAIAIGLQRSNVFEMLTEEGQAIVNEAIEAGSEAMARVFSEKGGALRDSLVLGAKQSQSDDAEFFDKHTELDL